MSTDAVVDVRDVRRHFGAVRALDGVSLSVHRGEIFGLIGHNGAGKSTLFKLLLGLLAPTGGQLRVAGQDVRGADFRQARAGIGYLPENVVLWDNLDGLETLRFFARLKGADPAACLPLLGQVGLSQAARRPVREYSKGMRQRLGFAQALLGRPQVLFLDEPTTGLDPQAIHDFHRTLLDLRREGVTIVLSSHILSELEARVDRVAVLDQGRLRALGSLEELRAARPLPLRLTLRVDPSRREALRQALQTMLSLKSPPDVAQERDATNVQERGEDTLTLHCPREYKLAVLQFALAFGPAVLDLSVHEPSLEALFFGTSDERHAEAAA